MKCFAVVVLCLFVNGSANASEIYQCKDFFKKGTEELTIQSNQNGKSIITLNFKIPSTNEDFFGEFTVDGLIPSDGFAVEGTIRAGSDKINVTLEGSLNPGAPNLSLYGNGDRRVDYGYGNPLICGKPSESAIQVAEYQKTKGCFDITNPAECNDSGCAWNTKGYAYGCSPK